MSPAVFVDTAAWLARVRPDDERHTRVIASLDGTSRRLVSTNFVLDELVTLAQSRYGHAAAVRMIDALSDADVVEFVRISAEDERAALDLFRARPDKHYSLTDCTSFVVMRRLGIDTAITLDDDFRREGFTVLP